MSRVINIIAQIIHLAKKAKKLLEKGKDASAKRLIKKIINLNEDELKFIKNESLSVDLTLGDKYLDLKKSAEDFYRECFQIYSDAKQSFKDIDDLSSWKPKEAIKLLERIIALERHQLSTIQKPNQGLSEDILKELDPYIKELVNNINKLSFVYWTLFSCSGHNTNDSSLDKAYIVIEYNMMADTRHNITPFHREMQKICTICGIPKYIGTEEGVSVVPISQLKLLPFPESMYQDGIDYRNRVVYYLFENSMWERIKRFFRPKKWLKEEVIKKWNLMYRLVKKYQDNDSLQYKKERMFIKEDPKLLDKH